jgi:branched-chain amino acid transport system permease protein
LRPWLYYGLGMGILAVLVLLLQDDPYWLNLLSLGLVFGGLATAWNIIGGFGGQFSLGHAVFFGLGAYSVALLQTRAGWSPWLALVVAALIPAAVSLLIAWPLFRLKGPFFAIGTLALSEVVHALAVYFEFTGGRSGLRIPVTEAVITQRTTWSWVFLGFLALAVAHTVHIKNSRLGYYLIAVRDDDEAASAAGVNPLVVKTQALVISAAWTGLGGGLYVMFLGLLDPDSIMSVLLIGVRLPLIALIGGIGTIPGPVIGALLLQPGEFFLRGLLSDLPVGMTQVLIGLLLVLAAPLLPTRSVGHCPEASEAVPWVICRNRFLSSKASGWCVDSMA